MITTVSPVSIFQTYRVVKFDYTMVFKEENPTPAQKTDVEIVYTGDGEPFADATIRKLLVRSFEL